MAGGGLNAKMSLLLVGGREYALPIERIRHILAEPEIFPLIRLRTGFAGVFLFGESVIPQLQPAAIPSMDAFDTVAAPYTVICQSDYGEVGLPVDRAVRIVDVDEGALVPAPPDTEPAWSSQVFCWRDLSYPLLDIDILVAQLPYQ